MTLKRIFLSLLTLFVGLQVFSSLGGSLTQPQIQSRLELYQVDLTLHVAALQGQAGADTADIATLRQALVGETPYATAQVRYEEALQVARETRQGVRDRLDSLEVEAVSEQLARESAALGEFIAEATLNLGLLQVQQGRVEAARETWESVEGPKTATAGLLLGLWQEPPVGGVDTGDFDELDGWFRYRALQRLYVVQARPEAARELESREREAAQAAVAKLLAVSVIPGVGGLVGFLLLAYVLGDRLVRGSRSLLATNEDKGWETPWDWELVWQVLVVGFFAIGQLLLPLLIGFTGLDPSGLSVRGKAFYVFGSYAVLAGAGIAVLVASVREFRPLPEGWFRWGGKRWWLWGFGGYLVAVPVVVFVSLLNQEIWQGQGGSNPLLFLAVQAQDRVALAVFLVTASIAAPLFEEVMFRGFLLPSLTRYVPVWGAVVLSSLVFSIAHLNLSEVLPLTALGIVLAVVYTRSRSLLAPVLLHGLWNGGTLLSLFVLGSGVD